VPELDYGIRDKRAAEDASLGARAARLAADCGGASFSAGTKVLLANGVAVPISQFKPGDQVLATNTRTGKTRAETVSAVLVHNDTNRYDLKVRVGHRSAVIHTTRTHLFWVPAAHRWIRAAALHYGTHLRTPGDAKTGDYVIGFSKDFGPHAEENILEQVAARGRDPQEITALYTERQPCSGCDALLDDNLEPGTPISWSVPWGDDPILKAASNELLKGLIMKAGGCPPY